jgi:hypothetical protein
MLRLFKSLFKREKIYHKSEPLVEINPSDVQEPCVRITVGRKSILLSGRLWGKLGSNLEKITPDK